MKLATLKDGSRDGQLAVVSRDLSTAHFATGIATRLQQVLDDWNFIAPLLQDLSVALNHHKARHPFPFDPAQCMAPLPRAFQWATGAAYPHHRELASRARGVGLPDGVADDPRLRPHGGDGFLGPCDAAAFAAPGRSLDFEAQLAVVTGDVAMGATPGQALEGVRLLMLANGWRLRELADDDVRSRPGTAFAPVTVTPDELGDAWQGGRVHLPVQCQWNGRKIGHCDAGAGMAFHFGQLIGGLAQARPVQAGAIVGGGVVSDRDASRGIACIADKRALEILELGEAKTDFLQAGDAIRVEIRRDQASVFGAIEQQVAACG
jgi:fumarylacetoacetate (FAA) hydrolase